MISKVGNRRRRAGMWIAGLAVVAAMTLTLSVQLRVAVAMVIEDYGIGL